jgi:hypothetical protein
LPQYPQEHRKERSIDGQKRNPEMVAARVRRWRHANRAERPAIERRRDIRRRWRRDGLVSL